ncbi:AfsR/SARP family transcriptional regulator [Plantactinospora endophytica]|uniref:SARP family transcriptional regulator n=1 Tax=Plantactinospora endophytica TaxID=673535 RepID=A0ABQ4EC43_9ACTN|nr:BTAD domain-containing putative transcriptional regulator [Plantactinospora endophytica]GIG92306.1 SARP family transcriptional regulator [Plantactinospora endophytica]
MDFRILGPLEVWDGDELLPVAAAKQRVVLALLLLHVDRVVSIDQLIDELWSDRPPANPRATLHAHVHRLRQKLRQARTAGGAVLHTRPDGYLIRVSPHALDHRRWQRLVAEGRTALTDGAATVAVARLRAALSLWRGPALTGIDTTGIRAAASGLDEGRWEVLEQCLAAELGLGRHAGVLPELEALTAAHPYREGLTGKLMLALSRSGRRADALAAFTRARERLVGELGVEPGAELRRIQQEILRGEHDHHPPTDPTLRTAGTPGRPTSVGRASTGPAAPHADARGPAGPGILTDDPDDRPGLATPAPPPTQPAVETTVPPCLLPALLPRLVGRATEIERARHYLLDPDYRPGTLVVTGPAGVGKTSFVVRTAHAIATGFPDGQLYADLRGTQPAPVDQADVLGGFLRALGVRGQAVPDGLTGRTHLYRTLLARRRVLVVLDNAADARQVDDLLPNGPGCAAMVTSRTSLARLHGARMALRVLSVEQALTLLGDTVGPDRIAEEPEASRAIVERCGQLPLAVWVAGARLAARPHWTLASMARTLTDEHHRLDELTVGDVAVRASVELTYRILDSDARRALRLLGLLQARDFAPWALAALLGTSLVRAERLLDDLIDVHLVEIDSTGPPSARYRIHDLVRLVARERALDEEPPQECVAALRRLLGASLDLAERCDLELSADFLGVAPHQIDHWRLSPDEAAALTVEPLDWFDREHAFLVATVYDGLGAEALPGAGATAVDLAGCLASSLTTFFQIRSHFDDWRRVQDRALSAVAATDDRRTALKLHRSLGELHTIQDQYVEAMAHFRAALDHGAPQQPAYEAAVISGLGYLHRLLGNYDTALDLFARAAQLAEQTGNVNGLVYALSGIGVVHLERRHFARAREDFTRALRFSREAGYRPGEAQALRGLGHVERAGDEYAAAAEAFRHAMEISSGFGDRLGYTHAACWLAEVRIHQDRPVEARHLLARCLWTYREFGNVWGEASTLWVLAWAQLAAGRPGPARRRATQSVAVWRRIGSPYWLARALDTLADALDRDGRAEAARRTRAEAAGLRHGRPEGDGSSGSSFVRGGDTG